MWKAKVLILSCEEATSKMGKQYFNVVFKVSTMNGTKVLSCISYSPIELGVSMVEGEFTQIYNSSNTGIVMTGVAKTFDVADIEE